MNDFIEAMIRGHDYTKYRWISGKYANECPICGLNNNQIKTIQEWQAEGLPRVLQNVKYHNCDDECSCRLEKV